MEFWGVEVKPGEPLQIEPSEEGTLIHLSQACLGESKTKGNEPVILSVKVGEKKLVLGTLSSDKFPQVSFDLVFEKEVEVSHNWKNGSVYLTGYQTQGQYEDFSDYSSDSDEEKDIPLNAVENGKGGQKVEQAKPASAKSSAAKPETSEKPKVKVEEPSKDGDSDDSDDDESDEDEDDSEDESDEDMVDGDSDSDDDDSDEEDDEETPKKPELSKKRPNDSASKTPVSAKKAKVASPKTDGKKAAHPATPHPAKKAGKTPATPDKAKTQSPKSGGSVSCKSCSKTFGSDKALESHTKAKHG